MDTFISNIFNFLRGKGEITKNARTFYEQYPSVLNIIFKNALALEASHTKNLKALSTIRNSYQNNGFDKHNHKLASFTTLEFIDIIRNNITLIQEISCIPHIEIESITDKAASMII